MSISARATAAIQEAPRNASDRDRLREEWRLASLAWSEAEDDACRLEEKRKMFLDEAALQLYDSGKGMPMNRAEKEARASLNFAKLCERMHDARRKANDLRIAMQNADRVYWEQVNQDANTRAEMRLSR